MEPATIKLFLVHGRADGLRTAELSNWSGKAIAGPRSDLAALTKRKELSTPGFYLLTGVDPDSGDPVIYIGEAEDVAKRLTQHSSKDYWNAAAVFVSKDENLTKAHIKFLEGKLIDIAASSAEYKLMNLAKGKAVLPEADVAEMEVFLRKTLQLLPVLGIAGLTRTVKKAHKRRQLHCKIKGLTAHGNRTAGGFTVYAGSQAVLEHRPASKNTKKRREQLAKKGVLEQKGDHFVFTQDIEFSSPSMAAATVCGGPMSGLRAWKNDSGKSLKEIEKIEE